MRGTRELTRIPDGSTNSILNRGKIINFKVPSMISIDNSSNPPI